MPFLYVIPQLLSQALLQPLILTVQDCILIFNSIFITIQDLKL